MRHTIANLAAHPPADVTALIKEAIAPLPTEVQTLLGAMSACAPQGFRLSLAAGMASLAEAASLEALYALTSRSLVDELNREQRRYRLHALVREAAGGERFAEPHAQALRDQFENWETAWQSCEQDLPDFQVAMDWALLNSASFAEQLAYLGYALSYRTGHPAKAFEICQRMSSAAEMRADKDGQQTWCGNEAVILEAWGRLEEALALLKKQEALCLELGNKANLARCYWSWGLLARLQNDAETEREKLTAALAIFTELKMPRERDAVAKALEQARGASQG